MQVRLKGQTHTRLTVMKKSLVPFVWRRGVTACGYESGIGKKESWQRHWIVVENIRRLSPIERNAQRSNECQARKMVWSEDCRFGRNPSSQRMSDHEWTFKFKRLQEVDNQCRGIFAIDHPLWKRRPMISRQG